MGLPPDMRPTTLECTLRSAPASPLVASPCDTMPPVHAGRYSGRAVLVTGAQGFIGSWLAERLLDAGARVLVPRRDVPAYTRFRLDGIERRCDLVPADVTDYKAMLRVLTEYEVSAVFHLAAQTIVGTANRAPLSTWDSNVRGTYTLLEGCRAATRAGTPVERVVVASSDKAYGDQGRPPYREEAPLLARYPYDVSKACTDLIARSYATSYSLPVAVSRLANVYGGGDMNFSRLVPDTARALVEGRRPVVRSDGSPERDWIYVKDAIDAYLAMADSLDRSELRGRAWNVGSGSGVSVLELVRTLIRVSGRELEPDVHGAGTPAGEIDRQVLDASAIRRELGWEQRFRLERGLRETWAWYERRLEPACA
jgi:CDP-glucose 4,6-dehydratase